MIARSGRSGADVPVDRERAGLEFLGPEFLTWLWWRSDTEPGFAHPGGDAFWVHFDDSLEFRGERAAARRATLRSGMPSASIEARGALRSGKLLVAARLLLARDQDEVRLTLRAEDLDATGVALPTPDEADPAERERILLERTSAVLEDVDLCLSTFLARRCSPDWPAEVERIRAWSLAAGADEPAGSPPSR